MRSERAFCEELEYNLLFRWFLDMNLMERSFDPTVFTKNRRRLLEHRIAQALFRRGSVGGSTPRAVVGTYDLAVRQTSGRYHLLYDRIRSYPEHVWVAQSTWVIATTESASEVRNYLKVALRRGDKLLVGILGTWAAVGLDRHTGRTTTGIPGRHLGGPSPTEEALYLIALFGVTAGWPHHFPISAQRFASAS